MNDKIQKALINRQERLESKKNFKTDDKISNALEKRQKRIISNLDTTLIALQKDINKEIQVYNNLQKLNFGYDTNIKALESTNSSRVQIGKLKNTVEAHRKYIGDDSADMLLSTLNEMSEGYNNYLSAAKQYSNFNSENDYNAYIMNHTAEFEDGMSAEGIAARIKAYEKATARLEAIDNEIANMSDEEKWVKVLNPYSGSQMAMQTVNEPSEKHQELLDEKALIQESITQYKTYNYVTDKGLNDHMSAEDYLAESRTTYSNNATYDEMFDYAAGKYEGEGLVVDDPLGIYIAAKMNKNGVIPVSATMSGDKLVNEYNNAVYSGAENHWELLKNEETRHYRYLLNKFGKEVAMSYLEAMTPTLGRRADAEMYEYLQNDASTPELVLYNAGSVGMNILGGITAVVDDFANTIQGKPIKPYNSAHEMQNMARNIRGATANKINTATDNAEFLGVSWGDAYQAAMSGIDSVVGAATFGKGYTVIMGMGAASSKAKQLYEQGASNGQIAAASLLSGVTEMAFEKFSIGHFLDEFVNAPTKKWYKLLGQTALQGGIEMTEEMATELSNIFTDVMVLGSRSEWEKLITSYKEQGYSDWEAISSAMWDKGGDILEAGISGFISGTGMGAGGSVINAFNTNKAYNEFYTQIGRDITSAENIKSLVAAAKTLDNSKSNAKVKALAAELEGVDVSKLNAKEKTAFEKKAGQLYEAVLEAQNKQGKASFDTAKKNIIREQLNKKGITDEKEIEATTQAIMKVVYNKGALTAKESELLEKVGGNEIASYLINNAAEVTTEGIVTALNNKAVINETKSLTKKQNTYAREINTDDYTYSGDGKTYIDGENTPVDITGIASIKNGRMTLELSDGRTAELGDVILGGETQAILYEGVLDMGVDAASAQAIVNSYDENAELEALKYVYGMRQAVEYGKIGAKAFLDTGAFTADLNPKQRELGYEVGRITAENAAKRKAQRKQWSTEKDKLPRDKATSGDKVSGGIRFDGITEKDLNETQKTTVSVFKQLFGGYGITIEFFRSAVNEKGVHEGENGSYDPSTNTIRLDVNAGAQGNDTILFTAAHELTHFIKEWSPEKFKVFSEFLLDSYAKHGVSVDELIKKQQAKAKHNGRELDHESAYEEVVADSCETFLRDSRLFDKLLTLKEKDMSLFDKTKKYISDLFDKVSGLRHKYKSFSPDSKEGKVVTQMTDTIERLHRLWEDAAMTALENSRRASGTSEQKNTAENGGEVKQSQRLGGYYPDIKVSTKDISIFGIKDINDLKEVKYRVYNYLLGKYVSNDKISKPIKNIDTGMDIYVYKGGIDETFGNTNAYKNLYTKNKKIKLATMTSLAKLIKYGEVRSPEAFNLHNPKSKNTYAYLTAPIVVDDITYTVNMDIKKTQHGNRFYVHTIKIASDSPRSDNSQTKYSNRSHNEVDVEVPGAKSTSLLKKSTSKSSIRNPESNVKQKQLEIIQQTNQMWDDYHTGIRTTDDIHTWAEVLRLDDEREGQFVWGDFSRADAEKALKDGTITVYSSYPIKNGVFVSSSYIQAQEYAGGRNGKVYSKTIPLTDVAWINGDEGQYAEIGGVQKNTAESGGVKYNDRDIKNDYSYENLNSSDYYTNDKIYSYKFLTSQKDMTIVNVPNIDNIFTNKKIDRAKIVATGKENAKNTNGSIVDEKDSVFVTNVYTKKRYRIDNQSIKHGLGGDKNYLITNSRLGMVIGDIVKNAIPINALKNKTSDVEGTFAMVSYGVSEAQKEFISIVTIEIRTGDVKSVETIESVHSVSGRIKKGSRVGNKPQGDRHMSNPFTTSTISISQLLEIVNSSHQSILSDDVLNHFGKTRNLNGTYSNDVLFSDRDPAFVSDRDTSKPINSWEKQEIENICNKFDIDIVFEDLRDMVHKGEILSPDGYIGSDGVIHINTYAENPLGFILKHELTHFGEKSSRYFEFVNIVRRSSLYKKWLTEKTGESDLRIAQYKYKQAVANAHSDIYGAADPKAQAEMIADFVGENLFTENGSGLVALTKNMDTKQRSAVVQFVIDFISYIKKKISGQKFMTLQLSIIEDSFNRMLSDASQVSNDCVYSYGDGVSFCFAPCNNEDQIAVAEKLEAEGKDCYDIFMQCGLIKDAYGKWKYELNTSGIKIFTSGNAKTESHYINNKIFKPGGVLQGKLSDFIYYKKLFEAFPQMKDVKVIVRNLDTDVAGFYIDRYDNDIPVIVLDKKFCDEYDVHKPSELKTALLREIQHVIQYYSGERSGTSLEQWELLEEKGKTPYSQELGRNLTAKEAYNYSADNYEAAVVEKREKFKDYYIKNKFVNTQKAENMVLYAPDFDRTKAIITDEDGNYVIVKDYETAKTQPSIVDEDVEAVDVAEEDLPDDDSLKSTSIETIDADMENTHKLISVLMNARGNDFFNAEQLRTITAGNDGFLSNVAENSKQFAKYYNAEKIKDLCDIKLSKHDTAGRVLGDEIQERFKNTFLKNEDGKIVSLYMLETQDVSRSAHAKIGIEAGTLESVSQLYSKYNKKSLDDRQVNIQEVIINMTNPLVLDYTPFELSIAGLHDFVERGILYYSEWLKLINYKRVSLINYTNNIIPKIRARIKSAGYDGIIYYNDSTDAGSMTVVAFDEDQILTVAENGVLLENNGISESQIDLNELENNNITLRNSKEIRLFSSDLKYQNRKLHRIPSEKIRAGNSGFIESETSVQEEAYKNLREALTNNANKDLSGKDTVEREQKKGITNNFNNTVFQDENGNLISLFAFLPHNTINNNTTFGTLNSAIKTFIANKEELKYARFGTICEVYINSINPFVVKADEYDGKIIAEQLLSEGKITQKEYYNLIPKNPAYKTKIKNKLDAKGYDSVIMVNGNGEYAVLPLDESQIVAVASNGMINDDIDVIQVNDIGYEHNKDYDDGSIFINRDMKAPVDLSKIKDVLSVEADNTMKMKMLTKVLMCGNDSAIDYTNEYKAGSSGALEKGELNPWRARAIIEAIATRDLSNITIGDTDTAGRPISEYKKNLLRESKFVDYLGRPYSVFIGNRYGNTRFKHSNIGLRVGTLNAAHDITVAESKLKFKKNNIVFEEYYPIVKNPYFIMFEPNNMTAAELAKYMYAEGLLNDKQYNIALSKRGAHSPAYNTISSKYLIKRLKQFDFDCIAFMNEQYDPGSIGLILFDGSQLIPVSHDGLPIENSDRTLADSDNEPAFFMPENNGENFVGKSQKESVENVDENGIIEETVDNDTGVPGEYTYKIVWQGRKVPARRDGKGHRGPRTKQHNERVNNYELKLNPDNESYFLDHPDGKTVQFENMKNGIVQDCKLVMDKHSIYYVKEKIPILNKNILKQAIRQLEAANSVGYKVEWLVSDQKAVDQMIELFNENNLDIIVTYYPE